MAYLVSRSVPQLEEIAARAILSKVQKRVWICSASGALISEDGFCPIHGEFECAELFIDYNETLSAVRDEF